MPILERFPTAVQPKRFDPAHTQVDEIKLFPAFPSERIAGWLRTGGCTAGCGACCEAFVVPLKPEVLGDAAFEPVSGGQVMLPINPEVADSPGYSDWEYWLQLHEAWLLQLPSGLLVLPVPVEVKKPAPDPLTLDTWVPWLEAHGISLIQRPNQALLAYVNIPCTKLEVDGRCAVFGTSARPVMCGTYPEHPMDIEGIEFCTYRFDPVTQQQIIEVAPRSRPQPPRKKKRKKGKRHG